MLGAGDEGGSMLLQWCGVYSGWGATCVGATGVSGHPCRKTPHSEWPGQVEAMFTEYLFRLRIYGDKCKLFLLMRVTRSWGWGRGGGVGGTSLSPGG